MFEEQFSIFLEDQRRSATGQRLEMLNKDMTGEKKMFEVVLWPVFKSFEGFVFEYEVTGLTGAKIYIDAFYQPLGVAFESEGYVVHAENITRDRFNFEKMRVRSMAMHGFKYFPYSWDELDKKPEACRRAAYELLGRISGTTVDGKNELSVAERELLRFALRMNRPIRLKDACNCLELGPEATRSVLRSMLDKRLLKHVGRGTQRLHRFEVEDGAARYLV